VRVSRPFSVWRARRALAEVVGRGGFDVVVCNSAWAHSVFGPAVRAARVPLVLWLHDAPGGRHWLERWARLTAPDLVVCNSHFSAASARRLYPRAPAEVIYCPVSPRAAAVLSGAERAAVRAALDTPADATVIVQASRMEPWKGHALHLEALGLLRETRGWVCWQVGGGQRPSEAAYLEGLRGLSERLGIADRVRFAGQREDVARLLAAADIFCQPNTGPEPFGLAFVEAMLARLPVVTTDTGGAREIVDHTCGARVPPGDARSLAQTLGRLVDEPRLRERLGQAGPARARQLCDPARQLSLLRETFERLARGRRAA
jgi:glycosyltransferase involved in cell wall biosynthesis